MAKEAWRVGHWLARHWSEFAGAAGLVSPRSPVYWRRQLPNHLAGRRAQAGRAGEIVRIGVLALQYSLKLVERFQTGIDIDELARRAVSGREELFAADFAARRAEIAEFIASRRIAVIGAAGSIGRLVVELMASFGPAELLCIDISENGIVELTRRLRNRFHDRELKVSFWPLDFGTSAFHALLARKQPEVILNFAAYKHVRSGKDAFSVAQMLSVNLLHNWRLISWLRDEFAASGETATEDEPTTARKPPLERFFAISTDKAANPVSLMGASKRLMEELIFAYGDAEPTPYETVTSTRFANVLFSDGSLPASFLARLAQGQPLAGPTDVERYFITPDEAADLCLLAAFHSTSGELLVPRMRQEHIMNFQQIAEATLAAFGLKPRWYEDGEKAFAALDGDRAEGYWPCLFAPSDTSGEKDVEEFVEEDEKLADEQPYAEVEVLSAKPRLSAEDLSRELSELEKMLSEVSRLQGLSKGDIVAALSRLVPSFQHLERGKSLDAKL